MLSLRIYLGCKIISFAINVIFPDGYKDNIFVNNLMLTKMIKTVDDTET